LKCASCSLLTTPSYLDSNRAADTARRKPRRSYENVNGWKPRRLLVKHTRNQIEDLSRLL
jgi:hypothetical protein